MNVKISAKINFFLIFRLRVMGKENNLNNLKKSF